MIKEFASKWWGIILLTFIYLYMVDLFGDYIMSREVMPEIQIVLTLGVLVYTYYMFKLSYKFIINYLKQTKK